MSKVTSSKRKAEWIAPSFGFPADDFLKPARQVKHTNIIDLTDEPGCSEHTDAKPWAEKYKPSNENDLAVHKKKIEDVKRILQSFFISGDVVGRNEAGILLLSGPAGAGKSALIEILAKQMNCKLKEWINPVGQDYQEKSSSNWRDFLSHQSSQSQTFNDFLLRANRYCGLQMVGENRENDENSRMIVLVEDLPNFVLRDPKKLHEMLRVYLKTGRNPLVFIISDSNTSDASVHSIFSKKIQIELKITNISFNGVATTSLLKAMTKIVKEESKSNENIIVPSKEVYDLIVAGCNGDIRSCINSLQFYCVKGTKKDTKDTKTNPKVKSKTKTKTKVSSRMSPNVDDAASFCGRDASLFLFRALGKVLYCKRGPEPDPIETRLPLHLKHHTRCTLQENPEDVFDRTQMSSDTFVLYLHQNYTQFFTSIDDFSSAASYLSCADLMMGAWTSRQILSDYCSSLGIRGIMFSNRKDATSTASKGGWRPLHKPQWFENFKTRNQNFRNSKDLFLESRESSSVLFTEYLPFLSFINTRLKSPDHNSVAQNIGRFNKNRNSQKPFLQTINDGMVNAEDDIGKYSEFKRRQLNTNDADVITVDEDEELIEDFDDL